MKTRFLLIPLALLVFLVCLIASTMAAPVMMVGSLVTVNNTSTNSLVTAALQYNPTLQQFMITHGALTSTNALAINIFVNTTGTTNGVQVGTWYPSSTNATTEYINANTFSITNYVWVQAVTTNSVQVGGSYGQ